MSLVYRELTLVLPFVYRSKSKFPLHLFSNTYTLVHTHTHATYSLLNSLYIVFFPCKSSSRTQKEGFPLLRRAASLDGFVLYSAVALLGINPTCSNQPFFSSFLHGHAAHERRRVNSPYHRQQLRYYRRTALILFPFARDPAARIVN